MIERIKNGTRPTDILKEVQASNPQLTNHDLARWFSDHFDELSLDGIQGIWYWERGRTKGGHTDQELDAILLKDLENAGVL